MDINATILGQIICVWVIIATTLTFFLTKRKTQTPVLASVIGFFIAFIPPLSLIYIIILVLKNDIIANEASEQ
ncbi:MAG: hypothetical protein GY829_11015 [Gammaproteobacteria bacterium]|nr:hypothetical protein [Gammaproteobacteria bacterium]